MKTAWNWKEYKYLCIPKLSTFTKRTKLTSLTETPGTEFWENNWEESKVVVVNSHLNVNQLVSKLVAKERNHSWPLLKASVAIFVLKAPRPNAFERFLILKTGDLLGIWLP